MATAAKLVIIGSSFFSSALNAPSRRGYTSTAPCRLEVRNGAASKVPAGTMSPKKCEAGLTATVMGSPACNARLAMSEAKCSPLRSCRARTETLAAGSSVASAHNSKPLGSRPRTQTSGVRSNARNRFANDSTNRLESGSTLKAARENSSSKSWTRFSALVLSAGDPRICSAPVISSLPQLAFLPSC